MHYADRYLLKPFGLPCARILREVHFFLTSSLFGIMVFFFLPDLGFHGGKSKSLYGRDGHLGITLIKFSSDQAGLKEAICLAEHFDRDNRGRRAWAHLQPLTIGTKDDENNPHLMQFDERTREKKRIFYGYLGTATDLDKVDFETKKKVVIESWREYMASK